MLFKKNSPSLRENRLSSKTKQTIKKSLLMKNQEQKSIEQYAKECCTGILKSFLKVAKSEDLVYIKAAENELKERELKNTKN